MGELFIIVIILFILYSLSKSPVSFLSKDSWIRAWLNNTVAKQTPKTTFLEKSSDTVTINPFSNQNDDSVIDIADQSYKLDLDSSMTQYSKDIPYWPHQYVYSYSEINNASKVQQDFYRIFKNSFLNGNYIDLKGNTNYAFILLFDILNEYERYKNVSTLEQQLRILGQYYPKTKSYGISFLIRKMEANGDSNNASRLRVEQDYEDNYWKLGNKYKSKLNLSEAEVKLLNQLYYPSNNFCNIEYCFIEVLKLYLSVISDLKDKYVQDGTTIEKEFIAVADIVTRKQFNCSKGSPNYKYFIEMTVNELHVYVLKYCENAVREYYGHKRKINTEPYANIVEANNKYNDRIISKIKNLLPVFISNVALPDNATEIELYARNTNRWKFKFEELTKNYNQNPKEFVEAIILLGKLNSKNPSLENIFFEASKFIANYNKESALYLYVHYVYHDLHSSNFKNRQFPQNIQKNLFSTGEQQHDFKKIVDDLVEDKNLGHALSQVSKVYEIKRKRIQLDTTTINEVQLQHSGTVELLNKYLVDDVEEDTNQIISEAFSEKQNNQIKQEAEKEDNTENVLQLTLTSVQVSVLELFSKNNLSLSQEELDIYARSKGLFKNQLIESINDACYEFLDDILIEEDNNCYTISTNYFQRIYTK